MTVAVPMEKVAGPTFTPITLDEVRKVIFSAYHAMDPKQVIYQGEVCIDVFLNEEKTLSVRIMTSVHGSSEEGAGRGTDPMRVGIFAQKRNRFIEKTATVKRTPNWKSTLRERVEDKIELYEDDPGNWRP
ncbi:MAG: hypothetical protein WC565_09960 [Parcubacteria group bacterium]|jgi:hypothetical protein